MNDIPPQIDESRPARLSGLSRNRQETHKIDEKYSAFIRSMRIVLPLLALCIIAVLFSWNALTPDKITPAQPDKSAARTAGKNELINPKFESLDDKNQPYTITAAKALQNINDELVLLTDPFADIVLNSGNWLAIRSKQGAFRQQSELLLLKDEVELFHDGGYRVKTQELNVDMKAGIATTDLKIAGHGPMGTLNASGMRANTEEETLIFIGPAKIVIYDRNDSSTKGLLTP